MGFKCPICFADFEKDKLAWEQHCVKAHNGTAQDLVCLVKKIASDEMKEVKKLIKEE